MPTTVLLDRRFSDLTESSGSDTEFSWAFEGYGSIDWNELLASPRVLIVSEAGTGKTFECQAQQRRMWDEGKPAFWIELASLGRNELPNTLGNEALVRFQAWLDDPSSVATFFLDSVDELLLMKNSFEQALIAVDRAIGPRAYRARFVVTSRPTDFDRQAVIRILPFPECTEIDVPEAEPGDGFVEAAMGNRAAVQRKEVRDPIPVVRTVGLLPLSESEVQRFVVAHGVTDPAAFSDALAAKNAFAFARRPQDLIELIGVWKAEGRLRTYHDQVALNAEVKLRGARRRNERQLPFDKAIKGARILALTMLLTRRLALKHGADSDSEHAVETVLDPRDVLVDWTDEEIKALLERPLFGHAGYGRVRFHHRSVVEFLAAEQLKLLREGGAPWRNVADRLFAITPQGMEVIRPSMRPTAVWLAAHSREVFEAVIAREPEAMLQYGDPETLDERDRLRALMAYVNRVGSRQREGLEFYPVQVQRFACAEVVSALPDIWDTGLTNPDVRKLFLQMFTAWPSEAGTRIAFAVLTDANGDHLERIWAAEALIAANDPRLRVLAEELALNTARWPDGVAASVALRLVPRHIGADSLRALLDRMVVGRNSPGRDLARSLCYQLTNEAFEPTYLERLRDGLVASVVDGMHWTQTEYPRYWTVRPDLAELLAALCMRLLSEQPLSGPLLAASIVAVQVAVNESVADDFAAKLRATAAAWPESLRCVAFVASHALLEGIHPGDNPFDRLNALDEAGLVRLSVTDGPWVMAILADRNQSPALRATALTAALQGIAPAFPTPAARLRAFASAVADVPELSARVAQVASARRDDPKLRRMRATEVRRRQAHTKKEAHRRAGWQKFVREILADPDVFFTTDRAYGTAWNIWLVMSRRVEGDHHTGWDRPFLEAQLGVDIANRLKQALRNVWRTDKPTLPHERPPTGRNTTLVRWGMGNAALAAESEDASWALRLSPAEAALAARYVPIELNRFPLWLPALAVAHPGPVRTTLAQLIDDELACLHDPQAHPTTLQHVEYADPVLQALIMPQLEAWLSSHAVNLTTRSTPLKPTYGFERLIRLVLKHGSSPATAALLSTSLEALARPAVGGWELLWFCAAFSLDPPVATTILEQRLARYPVGQLGEGARLLAGLFGDRHEAMRVNARDERFTPDLLLRLTRLAYAHVRRRDDVEHIGSFTPDARDGAEQGRDALLTALLESDGVGAWDAKMALANDPLIGTFADRARALTLAHAAREAEGDPLTLTQVRAVLRGAAPPPMTQAQMFTLLTHRLDDLEDLLLSDTSPRETWARVTIEREMRRNIGHELDRLAAGLYSVNQEAVSADEKETDIRLLSSASSVTGVIELKVGKNASAAELRDTIQSQLVRKYLAPTDRRAGCLLVTVSSNRGWQHPDTGERLDINGLRQLLSDEAKRVEQQLHGQVRLTVRVLDLRPRLGIERNGGAGRTRD
ncbi:hypothetical protein [Luteibacter sp. UNCMF366Tsu5.1]|uniref:hypothetical protein n=1 Tax=Luteibacter sp. UNCMF366Tsu5.1 TaxID=1502758 RepID=UPI00090868AA|nr:hypothetical protein [Luteibacter sp. UNCMF366Tsu5.1]SFW28301.1 hypothetical protein SAMN02800691_0757 [Luteibacter sp. UNCMF366Tsu5.1]